MSLTQAQHRYLSAIRDFIVAKGFSPSYEEIGRAVGVRSVGTVHKAVRALKRKGYIRTSGMRSIEIVDEKAANLNSCFRGHERIWYFSDECPLCSVLARLRS